MTSQTDGNCRAKLVVSHGTTGTTGFVCCRAGGQSSEMKMDGDGEGMGRNYLSWKKTICETIRKTYEDSKCVEANSYAIPGTR